jgi:FKBP-type peptidyl-prolyl cis-trans isomerase (trigger factor)
MSKTTSTKPKVDHDHSGHDHSGHDHAGHAHAHATPADNIVQPNSKITVTVSWKKVEPVYTQVLQKAAQHLKADGFRLGKVPPHLAEKMLKKDALYEEVIEKVLPTEYSAALKDSKKLPISRPEVEPIQLEKGQDWIFDIYFAEQQPVVLGKYQDSVKKAAKEAQKEIEERNAEMKKAAKTEPKAGETAPDKTATPTELTEAQVEDVKLKHIFKILVETVKPKVQEILVRTEVNREIQRLVDQLCQLNLKVEDYLKSRQVTPEQLQQEYAASAVTSLQIEFILAEIAKEQKLAVTDKEIDETLEKIGGGKLSAEQRQDADYRSYLFSTLLKQKVVQHLLNV